MKIVISQLSSELHSQVIQALSNAQLLHKVELDTSPDLDQGKPERIRGLTSIRSRNCHLERQEDNTSVCSACGRRIPLTPQGELDLELIGQEMSLGRW